MRIYWRLLIVALAGAVVAAQAPAPSLVFTTAQATAGRALYQQQCASCHGENLAGRNEAPPLAGGSFMNTWRTRTTRDLVELMSATMPPNAPSLTLDQYLAIAGFILQSNGAVAGGQPLTGTTAIPIGTIATGMTTGVAQAFRPARLPQANPMRPAAAQDRARRWRSDLRDRRSSAR